MKTTLLQAFADRFGDRPDFVVRAPGRVNLIGEHTDYNDGFVLPMAIDRAIWIALRRRKDDRVALHSLDFPTPADFSLNEITQTEGWENYVRGMARTLIDLGFPLEGWEGVLGSELPIASGLSSSAALELATARAFWSLSRWEWDGKQMAQAAKRMENRWLGLKSGIMDQMISACGEKDHALLIDCRDLSTDLVPLPEGVSIVVMDTAVRRGLVDSAYNERVEQCQAAAAYFNVRSLRDVTLDDLANPAPGLDHIALRRARHVVSENERTLQAAAAMRAGDALALGKLMVASHASLRDGYEVSCRELDVMVEIAKVQPGCLGARMTGAGFGGCAIALVQSDQVEPFTRRVETEYFKVTQRQPRTFICQAGKGAELVMER